VEALKGGAHRAIEHDDALAEQDLERMEFVRHEGKETSFRADLKKQIDAS
jgi:hypothetical protein